MKASEKLSLYGAKPLSDLEMLEVLIGDPIASHKLWHACEQSLDGLSDLTQEELYEIPGIGPTTAARVMSGVELARRMVAASRPLPDEGIRSPPEVVILLRRHMRDAKQEHFMVIGLDARQRPKLVRTVGIGSLSQVDVHPREVFRPLMKACAHSCIIAHNHPSGSSSPSESDLELTERMKNVGKLVGIPVLDHIIVTDHGFTSLASLGWM